MRSVTGRELEQRLKLRLRLTPQELRCIGAHPALEGLLVGKPITETVRSVYFDTPDHRLHAQGMSLRLEAESGQKGECQADGQWIQTVGGGENRGGATGPSEDQAVVAKAEPDLAAIGDRTLRRAIVRAVHGLPLEPQFETVVTRAKFRLHSGNGDMELALDEGVVRAGSAQEELCEAELIQTAGAPELLLETATALFASVPIRLATESRAERGFNLLLGRSDPNVVPYKADIPILTGRETCGEALALFVASAAKQIELNRRAVLETDDPEAAHQLRVGLRRLRSALRAFRPIESSPATQALARYARELGQSVGHLRNADILLTEIHAPIAAARKDEPGFGELRKALVAHRDAARGEARAALLGEDWSRLQLHLALWPEAIKANPRLNAPVRSFSSKALAKSWRRAAKLGARLETLTVEERHSLRKALKTFRYAVEYFASLYDARRVSRLVKHLKRLQDVLGYLNDVATAGALTAICEERCPGSPAAHRAAGYTLGCHETAARQAWEDAAGLWKRLAKRRRFWA